MARARVTDTDRGWKRALAAFKRIAGPGYVAVGVPSKAIHASGIPMAKLAAIHEFGAPAANIPERSFLRSTFDRNVGKYSAKLYQAAGAILDGKTTRDAELVELGETMVMDIRATIRAGIRPALKPATIKRKGGRTTPLIDTAELYDSIDYEVRRK